MTRIELEADDDIFFKEIDFYLKYFSTDASDEKKRNKKHLDFNYLESRILLETKIGNRYVDYGNVMENNDGTNI